MQYDQMKNTCLTSRARGCGSFEGARGANYSLRSRQRVARTSPAMHVGSSLSIICKTSSIATTAWVWSERLLCLRIVVVLRTQHPPLQWVLWRRCMHVTNKTRIFDRSCGATQPLRLCPHRTCSVIGMSFALSGHRWQSRRHVRRTPHHGAAPRHAAYVRR